MLRAAVLHHPPGERARTVVKEGLVGLEDIGEAAQRDMTRQLNA